VSDLSFLRCLKFILSFGLLELMFYSITDEEY